MDFSVLVPLDLTVEKLESLLSEADPLIKDVFLIDKFEKKEWQDVRSLTFRCIIVSNEKTLSGEELEAIWKKIVNLLEQNGAKLRS